MGEELVGRRRALKLGGVAAVGAVAAGAATLAPQAASAAGPLSYNTITPYRSVDSIFFGMPKIRSGAVHSWDLWKDASNNSMIPSSAKAVTYNLTVTQTEGAAFLAIIPAEAPFLGISSINWTTRNADIANGGTVALAHSPLSGPGSVDVICGGAGAATHYLIDVTGYYI